MIAEVEPNISFAEFELDQARRRLLRDGEQIALNAKTFDLLGFLVEQNGRVVSKEEILEAVWPGQFVEEANLSVQISALRKALGETTSSPRFLVTVPGTGYKFVADVRFDEEIVIERQTIERIVVNDGELGDNVKQLSEGRRSRWIVPASLGLLFLVVLGFAGYRYFAPAAQSGIRSIAVLPFKPLVVGERDESLEMGMADTLIAKLSSVNEITVRPISAVRRYADPQQDPITAGREQTVDAVLDGQIQKSGDKIRVTVRLVNVHDGSVIWTNQFDEKFSDVFAVQDSISIKVANALALKLSGEEQSRIAKRYTENPEAYQLYMLGKFHYGKRTRDAVAKSTEYFKQAVEKDPNYALAWAGLAAAYGTAGWSDFLPPHEAYGKAKEAVGVALQLDDSIAEAHGALANIKRGYDWDLPGAEAEYKRALELDPSNPTTHHWYGVTLAFAGRHDEAVASLKRARELDPLSFIINKSLGDILTFSRRFDEAIEQYYRAIELDPNSPLGYREIGTAFYYKGLHDKAVEAWLKAAALQGVSPEVIARGNDIYRSSGLPGFLRASAKSIEQTQAPYISSYDIALRYSAAGDKELALDWLERAYNEHSSGMVAIDADLFFDNIRQEPRFLELRRRVGLRQL